MKNNLTIVRLSTMLRFCPLTFGKIVIHRKSFETKYNLQMEVFLPGLLTKKLILYSLMNMRQLHILFN